ncbi:MAG: tryptophan--tRNA ligase [Candidatus Kapaibacterium sp.]|nr:MAG: tryptophan--tRNA ligase [Candidatus Kapabacteria bacterium]
MSETVQQQVIFSGIQPSGMLTVGHIAGALRNWVALQYDYQCYFCVVDLHALTVRQVPANLRRWTLDCAAMYLAAGIDPAQATIFIQSHVAAHAELAWVLSTFTGFGEASRMTQFKEKSEQHSHNVNVGLFAYPILMAADILLYQTNLVPVGDDQKQHLELTRDLAQRFNNTYSPTFTIPEPYIPKYGARLMSLQDPRKKMSKSDPNQNATIFLADDNDAIRRKIQRAVTDSGNTIAYDPEHRPGISNLIEIYHLATGDPIEAIVERFRTASYTAFKAAVADALVAYVEPVRTRFLQLRADEAFLAELLIGGAERAARVAHRTLRKVYRKVGLWSPKD